MFNPHRFAMFIGYLQVYWLAFMQGGAPSLKSQKLVYEFHYITIDISPAKSIISELCVIFTNLAIFCPSATDQNTGATGRVGQVLRVVILDASHGGIQQPSEERIVLQG